MPADVTFHSVSPREVAETASTRRFPLGVGLTVAACASIGLWFAVAAAVRALLF
jgi:hypothetical protein